MEQEKIGKLIKKIRLDANLTQEKFAKKYGVTYQAVSKWETGKNIPDIGILKSICEEYNYDLNDFLSGTKNESKKKSKKSIIIIWISIIILILSTICISLYVNRKNDFNFSKLRTTCDNFKLYGSMAYSENKASIYISNITYCGEENRQKYDRIKCILYEKDGDKKIQISSYEYDENIKVTLDEFLNNIEFNIDSYSQTCKNFKENGLVLEIVAEYENDKSDYYEIPLKLDENCK